LTIRDYAEWRPAFDKHKHLRDKAGFKNTRVYRNADDPKQVMVWSEAADVPKAREALASQDIRNAMQEAGVVGPPKIHVIT
jgi:erythromycin esterase-like protein